MNLPQSRKRWVKHKVRQVTQRERKGKDRNKLGKNEGKTMHCGQDEKHEG
jgi:hypothetical protein